MLPKNRIPYLLQKEDQNRRALSLLGALTLSIRENSANSTKILCLTLTYERPRSNNALEHITYFEGFIKNYISILQRLVTYDTIFSVLIL